MACPTSLYGDVGMKDDVGMTESVVNRKRKTEEATIRLKRLREDL
jgi:hypothetical protein